MIPEEVNVVNSIPTGIVVTQLNTYINDLFDGRIATDDETVYFELSVEDEEEMAKIIGEI
jgi:hypothetical protein